MTVEQLKSDEDDWKTDEDLQRRYETAKSIVFEKPAQKWDAIEVLYQLPNGESLLGARVRRSLATFDRYVKASRDMIGQLTQEERTQLLKGKLEDAVSSIRPANADKAILGMSPEQQQEYCDSTLREFASFHRYTKRSEDAAAVLAQFGEIGFQSILDGVYDEDKEVRLVAITGIRELLLSHFSNRLDDVAAILDHWDSTIAVFVPRLLWLCGSKSRFAIPKLESCYGHENTTFAALSAKAIAIIDPSKREQSLKVIEDLATEGLFWDNLLAELRGETPYLGV